MGSLQPKDRRSHERDDPAIRGRFDAIYTLARASHVHDEHTGEHVLRIRKIVRLLAIEHGMDEQSAELLSHDAMLHDVGKLCIATDVLTKAGKLSQGERAAMRMHTIQGEAMLAHQPTLQQAATIARHHHESFDGTGHPDGLAGHAIPLAARITTVADVLDALVSKRPYKDAWPLDCAVEEIRSQSGKRFDPKIVDLLLSVYERGLIAAIYDQGEKQVAD